MTDINEFVEKKKGVRRLALGWAVALITFASVVLYTSLDQITPAVATVYGITVGILGTIVGVYFRDRHEDDRLHSNNSRRHNYERHKH